MSAHRPSRQCHSSSICVRYSRNRRVNGSSGCSSFACSGPPRPAPSIAPGTPVSDRRPPPLAVAVPGRAERTRGAPARDRPTRTTSDAAMQSLGAAPSARGQRIRSEAVGRPRAERAQRGFPVALSAVSRRSHARSCDAAVRAHSSSASIAAPHSSRACWTVGCTDRMSGACCPERITWPPTRAARKASSIRTS